MDQSASGYISQQGYKEKLFPEQGQISLHALKSFNKDDDITSLRVKFESYDAILTYDPLLEGN
jgi:hypothetical protein